MKTGMKLRVTMKNNERPRQQQQQQPAPSNNTPREGRRQMSYSEPRQFSSPLLIVIQADRTLLFHPVEDGAAETVVAEERGRR